MRDERLRGVGGDAAAGLAQVDLDPQAEPLDRALGVVQTTMANKAGIINRLLDIAIFEPDLTRVAMMGQHPMAWLVADDGFIIDARTLPAELQDEARRRGLIPDLEAMRAA